MANERAEGPEDDGGMGRLLRERLPRHPATPVLRSAVVEALMPAGARQSWWVFWMPPACSAVATALVMLLWIAPSLPSAPAVDPAQLVARAVLVYTHVLPPTCGSCGLKLERRYLGESVCRCGR